MAERLRKLGARHLGRVAAPRPPRELDPERLPWWFDPLVSRLSDIETGLGSWEGSQLQTWITYHRHEIFGFMSQLVARDRTNGEFQWPVAPIADTRRASIAGNPTLADELPLEERRQIFAAADLLFAAWFANRQPTRVQAGTARQDIGNLDHPGDVVGVEYVRGARGAAYGRYQREHKAVEYRRFIHAKGVAGKILGATITLYGRPRVKVARELTRLATGVDLTVSQMRALIPPDVMTVLRTRYR